ncbi:MAG: hypothetical protein AAGF07_04895, partial [Patescibacteria group bacterium]
LFIFNYIVRMSEENKQKSGLQGDSVVSPERKADLNNQKKTFSRSSASRYGSDRRSSSQDGRFSRGVDKNSKSGGGRRSSFFKKSRDSRKFKEDEFSNMESQVILVRRVTRVVKGGKRMKFSALVVVGDKAGKVGFGIRKGIDFQDAVGKATKKAQDTMIKIKMNSDSSLAFPSKQKFKACEIMLKPAKTGTGLIAGGFLRPVLELAGIKNVYSKIITTRNKVVGVQATFEALKKYTV